MLCTRPTSLSRYGTPIGSRGWTPDIQRSGNGSVSGADYSDSGNPFGARLAGPFSRAVDIGLSPHSDSLGLATRPTLPGHGLFPIQFERSIARTGELVKFL